MLRKNILCAVSQARYPQVYFIQYEMQVFQCKIKMEDPVHKCREGKTNYSQSLIKATAVTMEVDSRSQMN